MRRNTKAKKWLGALLSALVMGGLLLVTCVCMLVDWFMLGGAGMTGGTGVILLTAGLFLAMVAGIGVALWQRMNEIRKGEEDEASKY